MTWARRPLTYLAVIAFVLALWEILTISGSVKPIILASPADVWSSLDDLLRQPARVLEPVAVTLGETGAAFGIGAVVAIVVGLLVGSSPLLYRAYEPLLTTANAVPLVVLYPLLAAILGIGGSSKIVLGALYAFFPVAIATARAAAHVDPQLLAAARAMGASTVELRRGVVLPAITAPIVASLRVGLALALVTVIAAEFIAGADGVGYELGAASQGLDTPALFAWVVIACALTVAINIVFSLVTNVVEKGTHR
jgi:ABC-type nitrate/sulfonate/bicarbonate transport system permease component